MDVEKSYLQIFISCELFQKSREAGFRVPKAGIDADVFGYAA
jgi:hypothetical protein